jgi:hypothetical protein
MVPQRLSNVAPLKYLPNYLLIKQPVEFFAYHDKGKHYLDSLSNVVQWKSEAHIFFFKEELV